MRYWLVMPAAGSGQRFGSSVPKTYAQLAGRALIEWSLAPFLADGRCAGICVALGAEDRWFTQLPVAAHARVRTVTGGAQRCDSVAAALAALTGSVAADDWVLVHDAARPCLSTQELEDLLAALPTAREGALLALPLADTLKRAIDGAEVAATAPREGLWRALTPQAFRAGTLARALEAARDAGRSPTDEAQAVEWTGGAPRLVTGSALNIKVTQATDLGLAEAILRSRGGASVDLRVGSGYDVHAFTEGDHVMLGGVRIAHDRGVLAHSDGDVLLHALCDALLGAAGLGDIGQHFPDSDPRWKGADSSRFVTAVRGLLDQQGFAVRNVDLTLVCEAPRIGTHRAAIRGHIARLLEVAAERVNLKATTTEKLGFEGRREGLAAHATVLIGPR